MKQTNSELQTVYGYLRGQYHILVTVACIQGTQLTHFLTWQKQNKIGVRVWGRWGGGVSMQLRKSQTLQNYSSSSSIASYRCPCTDASWWICRMITLTVLPIHTSAYRMILAHFQGLWRVIEKLYFPILNVSHLSVCCSWPALMLVNWAFDVTSSKRTLYLLQH